MLGRFDRMRSNMLNSTAVIGDTADLSKNAAGLASRTLGKDASEETLRDLVARAQKPGRPKLPRQK
jgi:hypothetical protein